MSDKHDFAPGDYVRCINSYNSTQWLAKGAVYEVDRILGDSCLKLVGVAEIWAKERFEKVSSDHTVSATADIDWLALNKDFST
jgi:hypothetical protein